MNELISVGEADSRLRAAVERAPAIRAPLAKAAGRLLREDLIADRPLPPFDRVMMDGYAVCCPESGTPPESFRIAGQALAGSPAIEMPAAPDAAIEVATGAALPAGANAVVPYEQTTKSSSERMSLNVPADLEPGQYIHRRGSDYAEGSVLVAAGSLLGPAAMGVAASCGYAELAVSPRPRIAIATTGDELVAAGETPAPHQIRASNGAALESALGLAGFNVGETPHWPDDPGRGRAALGELLRRVDILIVVGAISKGARDWLPAALDEVAENVFHGVRQRPGKPMGFWRVANGPVVFALPGNPVSALTCLHRYVLPFVRRRDGQTLADPPLVELAEGVEFAAPLTWFLPVAINAAGRAEPRPVNNSGDYARLAGSDGVIELPADASSWTVGFRAPFYPWSL